MKRQCKKCSSTSHKHPENQYKMGSHLHSKTQYKTSSYQERSKQRSAHVHGFHFSSDSHLAEWRLEHERFRVFRQRAQEKIDSLARILDDRRSRWSEEMDKIKGRRRGERYERLTADNVRRCMEKGDYETEQLHPFTKLRGESDRQSCFPSESHRRALLAKGTRRLPLSEKIQSMKSGEAQNLELRQRLDGLLGILKEEIESGSGGSNNHTRARDSKLFRPVEESKMSGRANEKDKGFVYCGYKTNDDACLCAQLDDDAYSVIDDFLSRLSSSPDSYRIGADASDLNFGNDCRTSHQGSAGNDFTEVPYTWAARNCPEVQVLRKSSLHERTRISAHDIGLEAVRRPSSHDRDSVTTAFSHDQRSNISEVGSKDKMFENMESSKACHSKEQQNTIQNQSKRSEQLLRTLERLREETQLVAAALESMKEHVIREFHKISGISTGGNCIIAT